MEYGIAFFLLLLAALLLLGWQYRKQGFVSLRYTYSKKALIGLLVFLAIDLLNTIFFHYQIIGAASFLLGGYSLLGFYLEEKLWMRGVFLAIIVTLTLPFIEHIQTFLGFPVRLMTANIVSALMHWMGISSISDSTVILTENSASVVDLPCSGVKSIYTGALFLCALFFFQRISFSCRTALVSLIFFASLLFFNIWRVFSLVYIYNVLQLPAAGNSLHVALGVGGFVASACLAWFLTKKFLASPLSVPSTSTSQTKDMKNMRWVIIIFLLCFLFLDAVLTFSRVSQSSVASPSNDVTFALDIQNVSLKEIPLTEPEKRFFQNREVLFTKKYDGKTATGMPFSLLFVSSKSWRTHHNPEVCLRGLGYQISRSELLQLSDSSMKVRQVRLDPRGTVLYWFASQNKTISDYSERVWAGILHPDTAWTLIEIGLNDQADAQNPEILELVKKINNVFTL